MPDTALPTNAETSAHDLFLLSDEQILEIEAEPQNIEIADLHLDDADRTVLMEPAADVAEQGRRAEVRGSRTSADGGASAESARAASHESAATSHDPAAPPQWLADRMSDPQAGAEARALWDSVQQSKAEADGFREIFAKPEEARAAAQRARLLDDIDRAYFGGDATQRASLAASMMREDPAAFREMVFAGLRALEQGAQSSSARGDASPRAHNAAPNGAAGNSGSSSSPNSQDGRPEHDPRTGSLTSPFASDDAATLSGRRSGDDPSTAPADRGGSARPASDDAGTPASSDPENQRSTSIAPSPRIASDSARDARHTSTNISHEEPRATESATDHIAANYAAFERSTNDDLERIVGTSIDRTLDRALPHANRSDNAAMRTRLAASIRHDIERSLQSDRQLGEQVAQVLSARRLDEATRSQVVRLIGERAQQLVAGTTKRVLGEWTQTTIAAHRERGSRADAASARRDVEPANSSQARPANSSANAASAQHSSAPSQRGPSSGRSAPSASPRAQKVDYRRITDDQILDW